MNAGVLVFNVNEIIERGLEKKLECLGYYSFPDNDQDVINKVFRNKIKLIPNKFNTIRIHYKDINNTHIDHDYRCSTVNNVIIHYVSNAKPWQYKSGMMANHWWKYIDMIDKKIYEEYINPFLIANKLPFDKRMKELIMIVTKRTHIYDLFLNARKYFQHIMVV